MRNFVSAYSETIKGGFTTGEAIKQHIENQVMIDKLLPDSASFFIVFETSNPDSPPIYHFMGKQQKNVSGYTNEEFIEGGFELWLQSIHPDELEIVVDKVYPKFMDSVVKTAPEDRSKYKFQYNYRFKRKDEQYLNLLEQLYILEVDQDGKPALILSNVVIIGRGEKLPIRVSAKSITDEGFVETVYSEVFPVVNSEIPDVTDRELDILRNLATGKTSKQIGKELFISPHTVDTHRRNLLKKLNCKSVVELVQLAFKNGLL